MTVVLLPIVAAYGVAALPILGLLAGVFLLVFAFARIGRYVNYVPWPVVSGFTNGIAIIIGLQQLPGLLGVPAVAGHGGILPASLGAVQTFFTAPTLQPLLLGSLAMGVMVAWPTWRRARSVPAGIVALVAVTLVSLLPGFEDVPRIGAIPGGAAAAGAVPLPDLDLVVLVRAALAIAVLAALESLLSAVVADSMTVGERHDPEPGALRSSDRQPRRGRDRQHPSNGRAGADGRQRPFGARVRAWRRSCMGSRCF